MINPFGDFQAVACQKKEIPLKRIVRVKQDVVDQILEGYLEIVEAEARDFVWLVEQSRVLKTYNTAIKLIQGMRYDADDIEEFCCELDSSSKIPYMLEGPAGIFLSALINRLDEKRIVLRLKDLQKSFHMLGYRLPAGKTLVIQGDAGDFTGAGLNGGHLEIEGSVGNWCGAGMLLGRIQVGGSAGWKTGEWMKAGEIQVQGYIQGVGQNIFGGKVTERGKTIYPRNSGNSQ